MAFAIIATQKHNHNVLNSSPVVISNKILFTGCSDGSYGENCSQTCGTCFGKVPCHKENGTCEHGCYSGYLGDYCKQSIS